MNNQLLTDILNDSDIRKKLSDLRKVCKGDAELRQACTDNALLERIQQLLSHEDAKTRKNAALLLGDLAQDIKGQGAELCDALWQAFLKEDTKFVRSAYIHSMSFFDCREYIDELQNLFTSLLETEVLDEEKKHIRELRKEIEQILSSQGEQKQYVFKGIQKKHPILLVAESYIQDALKQHLQQEYRIEGKAVPRGVRVVVDNLKSLHRVELYRELLFVIRVKSGVILTEDNIAEGIASSELLPLLQEMYGVEKAYPFRLSYRGSKEPWDSKKLKRICFDIEEASGHRLFNDKDAYLVEVQVYPKKDGTFVLYGRFPESQGDRFPYYKESLPTSMAPVTAAQMVELALPYLNEDAHVIDPFCGTGTLLIERANRMASKDVYGVDIYGEAIEIARRHTKAEGFDFYYINRDYFDFTSSHDLEELITEFPRMENKSREEVDDFYYKFFEQSQKLIVAEGVLIMLSTEESIMKKQLRLHKDFQLVRQIPMRGMENIFIIKKRG